MQQAVQGFVKLRFADKILRRPGERLLQV